MENGKLSTGQLDKAVLSQPSIHSFILIL